MILFAIFKVLLAVYITIVLPPIVIYIGNETDDFSVKYDKDYFIVPLKLFVMLIPDVAIVKAYKIYKKNNIS